jgi:LCP family protein required for cell wall assembly
MDRSPPAQPVPSAPSCSGIRLGGVGARRPGFRVTVVRAFQGQEGLVKRSTKIWAIIAGIVVLLGAGTIIALNSFKTELNNALPQTNLFGSQSPTAPASASASPTPFGTEIPGALNLLIVGVDTRTDVKGWVPHADAVMIMHVDPDHSHIYLFSLPRDLLVSIPSFAPSNFSGEVSKLTHAMAFGSLIPNKLPVEASGFQLLAQTVSNYTGIKTWNGGAVLTFNGLKNIVNKIGGIDIYVDEQTVSIHMEPNGTPRPICASCDHGASGPQAVYNVGSMHMVGWQALDYARQRYIDGAAYARERHQRQIIKAMITKIITTNYFTSPGALMKLFRILGTDLLFDGRGHSVLDFLYTLRHISPGSITLVGLPGAGDYTGGQYNGEDLVSSIAQPFFAAVRASTVGAFLKAHPTLINGPKPTSP